MRVGSLGDLGGGMPKDGDNGFQAIPGDQKFGSKRVPKQMRM
jgi:hypothetical protein